MTTMYQRRYCHCFLDGRFPITRLTNKYSKLLSDGRKNSNSSSTDQQQPYQEFQDVAFQWAKKHPQLARQVLQVPDTTPLELSPPPPFLTTTMSKNQAQKYSLSNFTLVDYLKWRQWTLPQNNTDNDNDEAATCALRLVSHTLSAPLTLAASLLNLLDTPQIQSSKSLRCCCVGARAEATLPPWYWKEVLVLLHHATAAAAATAATDHGNDNNNKHCCWNVSIDFVGPDVTMAKAKDLVLSYQGSNLTLNWSRGGGRFFHQLIIDQWNTAETTTAAWDVMIFFNPGFGHPNLHANWQPTLETLFHSNDHRFLMEQLQLLLITAHSPVDVQRDVQVLQQYYIPSMSTILRATDYTLNPFCSRIVYADPCSSGSGKGPLVQPNLYAYQYYNSKHKKEESS